MVPPIWKHYRRRWMRFMAGCITCKDRQRACDLQKPLCELCATDQLECAGYDEADARRSTFVARDQPRGQQQHQQQQQQRRLIRRHRRDSVLVNPLPLLRRRAAGSLCPRPSTGLSLMSLASGADAFLLHHANQFLFKDSVRFDDSAGFWYGFALPLSTTADPVRQALCALGGAHRSFVDGAASLSSSLSPSPYGRLAVAKYNEAVALVRRQVTTNSAEHLRVSLVCCVVFVHIESLHGRVDEAIKHLQAGCLILSTLRKYHGHGHGHCHSQGDGMPRDAFVSTMSTVLLRIWQDFADFQAFDTFYLPDLEPQMANMGDASVPFPDATTAMEMLYAIDDVQSYLALSHHAGRAGTGANLGGEARGEPEAEPGGEPEAEADVDREVRPLCLSQDSIQFAFQSSKPAVRSWLSRMGLFLARHEKTAFVRDERYRVQMLSLYHTLLTGLAKLDSLDDELDATDCGAVLASLGELFRADAPSPVFSLGGHLIPVLSRVFANVRDGDVRRACIAILRSARRREGVWDSHGLADLYEAALEASSSAEGLGEALPFGVPQLTERLGAMGLLSRASSSS